MKYNFLFNICLLAVLSTSQCRKAGMQQSPVAGNTNIHDTIIYHYDSSKTFLALGDSYTIGQSVSIAERFPHQTAALLRSNGITINDPRYIATTGWTTENLRSAIDNQQPLGTYSVVTLLIGVNDQYQAHDTTGYRERFMNLLAKSITLAGNYRNHVFVLSIPDYSVTPFAASSDTAFIRKQIDEFNDINRQETFNANCHYLDITPFTREALTDATLLANDGLHPSGKEYGIWAASLSPMMKLVLQ